MTQKTAEIAPQALPVMVRTDSMQQEREERLQPLLVCGCVCVCVFPEIDTLRTQSCGCSMATSPLPESSFGERAAKSTAHIFKLVMFKSEKNKMLLVVTSPEYSMKTPRCVNLR